MINDTQSAQISLTQDERNTCNHAMCPPGYYHSGSIATRESGQTMYGYTLTVPKNQRVLNKLSKERNTTGQKWFMIHRVLKSHWRKMSVIHVIMQWECALPVITIVALYGNPSAWADDVRLHNLWYSKNQRVLNITTRARSVIHYWSEMWFMIYTECSNLLLTQQWA